MGFNSAFKGLTVKYIGHLYLWLLPKRFINRSIFSVKDGNLYHEGRGSGFFPRHDGIYSPIITVSTVHTMSNLYSRLHNCLITRDTTTWS